MGLHDSVSRKAILIGSPGENPVLRGVKSDLNNIGTYLRSEKGGAWYSDEIQSYYDPPIDEITDAISQNNADYLFVYFSGHGYTESYSNKRMLNLKDKQIEDVLLLNRSPKQLIIIDACRSYVTPGITGIPGLGPQWLPADGMQSIRDYFDDFISSSPEGKLIVHATQKGEFSYDSPNGGAFTKALLEVASDMTTQNSGNDYAGIELLLKRVPFVLLQKGNQQVPAITYKTGDLRVPFTVGIPIEKPKVVTPIRFNPVPTSKPNWAGWALFGFLIFLAIRSSDE